MTHIPILVPPKKVRTKFSPNSIFNWAVENRVVIQVINISHRDSGWIATVNATKSPDDRFLISVYEEGLSLPALCENLIDRLDEADWTLD